MDQSKPQTSPTSYVIGFVLSIVLTLVAYVLVINHILTGAGLIAAIIGLGIVQLFVQLYFFVHVGKKSSPRWNFIVLLFAALVVAIVIFGSLWIMNNLNYNMMQGTDVKTYMHNHEGL
jgi:cytochrome o ubiquinol oxidase operon protein cyoD